MFLLSYITYEGANGPFKKLVWQARRRPDHPCKFPRRPYSVGSGANRHFLLHDVSGYEKPIDPRTFPARSSTVWWSTWASLCPFWYVRLLWPCTLPSPQHCATHPGSPTALAPSMVLMRWGLWRHTLSDCTATAQVALPRTILLLWTLTGNFPSVVLEERAQFMASACWLTQGRRHLKCCLARTSSSAPVWRMRRTSWLYIVEFAITSTTGSTTISLPIMKKKVQLQARSYMQSCGACIWALEEHVSDNVRCMLNALLNAMHVTISNTYSSLHCLTQCSWQFMTNSLWHCLMHCLCHYLMHCLCHCWSNACDIAWRLLFVTLPDALPST